MSDISYELAKKLWDAGYPFKRRDSKMSVMCLCTKDVCDGMFGREFRFDGNLYPEPTLEELLEECGEKEDSTQGIDKLVIWFNGADWSAGYYIYGNEDYIDSYPYPIERGASPKEAMVNLYLALKRNPTQ